jgi:predicted phage baseplate assembly protein
MPLEQEALTLDSRSYDQIRRDLLARIPRYLPEWTDYNASDPGITLIELFAWLGEQLLVELNRVPERSYIKFLKLLGHELKPAVPAIAHLTCTALPNTDSSSIPSGAQFAAQPPGADLVVFEAAEGLSLIRLPLTDLQVFDGAVFTVVSDANIRPGVTFRPFGWSPQVGSALYLGFKQEKPEIGAPFPATSMTWHVFFPPLPLAQRRANSRELAEQPEPVPPVELAWEYRPADDPGIWRRLQVQRDKTAAFTRAGSILVEAPPNAVATVEGRVKEPCFWLRVRLAERSYPAGRAPLIDIIRPNVIEVQSLATVREEALGASSGLPNQIFSLQRRPVQPQSIELDVESPPPDRVAQRWERRDDLLASEREDRHFVLNATAGTVQFGDGANGLIPVANSQVIARRYQYGGGQAANVGADMIRLPLSAMTNIAAVTNEYQAVGGSDEQSLDDFLKNAPASLRHRGRAVSAEDYAALAEEVGGVGKAIALPLFHPDYPDIEVPGAVTVVVVPETIDPAPAPSPALLEAVCRYLEPKRTIGTELAVIAPSYTRIEVEATVGVSPYASFDDVRQQIIAAINADLDPLGRARAGATERGEGREFGLNLVPTRLFSVIQQVEHVRSVSFLAVNGQEGPELNTPIEVPKYGLVYGAPAHAIHVVPYEEHDGPPGRSR